MGALCFCVWFQGLFALFQSPYCHLPCGGVEFYRATGVLAGVLDSYSEALRLQGRLSGLHVVFSDVKVAKSWRRQHASAAAQVRPQPAAFGPPFQERVDQ